ncbi:MAG: hypothetical protein FI707_12230 [SAR202 cluster bacterium]|jgi:hypothetical protein|nr:hypothetical protein [Chloroflexota bacterium]MDP6421298.1 hypothetical protein [SAR202 cluster bacterium]HAL46703.1 hypothetical protein [Dehalococcoidia bacterium]MDP6664076.1 hypothetical protein [SAR202 cluster bacterium]MDP6799530.1 hypothetical protein [SAR202 cluster bacterium]|tara:strand:+ start:3494 stop:3691 length:198 start_codon:yes stop_codon:yes gene_type:complete
MADGQLLSVEERQDIESLIASFDNHGCGMGLDLIAQKALRRLLDALDDAEKIISEQGAGQAGADA